MPAADSLTAHMIQPLFLSATLSAPISSPLSSFSRGLALSSCGEPPPTSAPSFDVVFFLFCCVFFPPTFFSKSLLYEAFSCVSEASANAAAD